MRNNSSKKKKKVILRKMINWNALVYEKQKVVESLNIAV